MKKILQLISLLAVSAIIMTSQLLADVATEVECLQHCTDNLQAANIECENTYNKAISGGNLTQDEVKKNNQKLDKCLRRKLDSLKHCQTICKVSAP